MKRILISMLALFIGNIVQAGVLIDFSSYGIPDLPIGNGYPKSPMRPPVVYIDDYTLTFVADHPDYVLTIKDEDGDVVHTTTVYSAETQVILPSTLSGEYEIELRMGYWKFTGWINL